MKANLILLLSILALVGCHDRIIVDDVQTNNRDASIPDSTSYTYYWSDGVRIPLTINNTKLFVVANSERLEVVTRSSSDMYEISSVNTINDYSSLGINPSENSSILYNNLTSFTLSNVSGKISDIEDDVIYVAPYFITENGSEIGVTNNLSVQLSEGHTLTKLQEIADECNLQIIGQNEFDPSIYVLSCSKESKGNSLEMANYIYESGHFEYASPEFIFESYPADIPNDVYFNSIASGICVIVQLELT